MSPPALEWSGLAGLARRSQLLLPRGSVEVRVWWSGVRLVELLAEASCGAVLPLKWARLDVERGRNVLGRLTRSDSAGTLYS